MRVYYYGCVSIFTVSTGNLQCTLRILQIFSTGSEYRNAAYVYYYAFQNSLPALKIYNARNVNFSILAMNFGTQLKLK